MVDGILGPDFLPWQQAGVDFLLAESDLPPEFSLCHAAQAAARHVPRNVARPGAPASPLAQAPSQAQAQAQPDTQGRSRALPFRPQSRQPAPPPAAQAAEQRAPVGPLGAAGPAASGVQSASLPLPPEHWPRPWRERLKATRPAPVVWTYWALGEDLCGNPNPARRELLKRLLGDLGHPAGTHTFWPAAMPAAGPAGVSSENATAPAAPPALEAHPPAFWAGLEQLKARAVVVMGSPAAKAVALPPGLRPFQQLRHHGKLVVVLRDVDFLVEEAHHYDAVREFLRRALAPFGR